MLHFTGSACDKVPVIHLLTSGNILAARLQVLCFERLKFLLQKFNWSNLFKFL